MKDEQAREDLKKDSQVNSQVLLLATMIFDEVRKFTKPAVLSNDSKVLIIIILLICEFSFVFENVVTVKRPKSPRFLSS